MRGCRNSCGILRLRSSENEELLAPPPEISSLPRPRKLTSGILLGLFLLALIPRLAMLYAERTGPLGSPDTVGYQALAAAIQDGKYAIDEAPGGVWIATDLMRPPGYPAFLVLLGGGGESRRMAPAIVQCVLGAVTALIVAWGVSLLASELAAVAAGLLFAFDWGSILHTPILLSETTYALVATIAVVGCIYASLHQRRRLALLTGCLTGAAAYFRPSSWLLLPVFFVAILLWRKERVAAIVLLVVGYMGVTMPWMARNYRVHRVFTMSLVDSMDAYLFIGEAAIINAGQNDWTNENLTKTLMGNHPPPTVRSTWDAIQSMSAPERKAYFNRQFLRIAREHWPTVIRICAVGAIRTATGPGFGTLQQLVPEARSFGRARGLAARVIPLLQVLILWLAALAGAVAVFRSKSLPRWFAVLVIGALLAMIAPGCTPIGYIRYRVAAVPEIAMLGGIGIAYVAEWRRTRVRAQGPLPTMHGSA